MDLLKIGKFIAERRKAKELTQLQLAEKLNITDRAVSKWETGKSLPDSSIMLELCKELEITVNDLLSGEVVTMEDYNKEMEKKLVEMVKEKEKADKHLLRLEVVRGVLGFSIKIEQTAGYYKCSKCGHAYVPTLKSVLWSPHMGRTRQMKCPKCGVKSWQKKVISKD